MANASTHVLSVLWGDGTCSVVVYPYKPTRGEMFGDVDAEGDPFSAKARLYSLKPKRNEEHSIHLVFDKQDGDNLLRTGELTGRSSEDIVFRMEDFEEWTDMHNNEQAEVQDG